KIVWNGRGYHNHRYIFPVGFRSKKQYTSLSDTSKKTYFISEILDGGDYPIFQITLEDMPDKVFRHTSSSGAWELALKGLIELGYNAKTHASGPDMYGLTNLGVIKHIQEMPNANRCRRYMPLKWIIDDEHTEGDLLANQLGDTGTIGVKSPGRKKKINNSIYASNHEVLMSSLKEEAAAKASASKTVAQVTLEVGEGESSPKAKLPPTPRKYTKRKSSFSPGAPTTATATAAAVATTATTATSLEEMAGCEPMEGVILGNNPTDRKSSSMAPLPLLPSLNEYEQDSRSMFEPRESDHAAKGTRSVTLQPPSYGRSQLEP
ncbi:transforming growth factor beta regulator 1, partial [Lunasporangiospora selenospora]